MVGVESVKPYVISILNPSPRDNDVMLSTNSCPFSFLFSFFSFFLGSYYNYNILKIVGVIIIIEQRFVFDIDILVEISLKII